ncbi:hypothetical protein QEN19_004220 [Hanseniaspora menglaensis]
MSNFKDIGYIKQQIILEEDSENALINDINDVSELLVLNDFHYNYNIDYLYKEIMMEEESQNTITDYESIIAKYVEFIDNTNPKDQSDNIDLNILIISIIDHLKYVKSKIDLNNDYIIKHICLDKLYKNIILKIDSFLNNLLLDSISLVNLTNYSNQIDIDVKKELTIMNEDMESLKTKILDNLSQCSDINIKDYPFIHKYLH